MSAEVRAADSVVPKTLPRHIAIIMDGNGRWAAQKGHRRLLGHRVGANSVREITRECARLGIGRLTLYAFSSENWRRPPEEIRGLMRLLRKYLVQERREILENNIRFAVIGQIDRLPADVREEIDRSIEVSRGNTGMVLCLALSYGGREEIVEATRRLAREVAAGKRAADSITEEDLARQLYDPGAPDPDLLIRTGGDLRISNFLLWQISYAELYMTPVYWPEFRKEQLHEALREYARRDRRFGGLSQP